MDEFAQDVDIEKVREAAKTYNNGASRNYLSKLIINKTLIIAQDTHHLKVCLYHICNRLVGIIL